MDILLNICFPLQGVGGRLGARLGLCGDCFHCLSLVPREGAESNGKNFGFGISQTCVHISATSYSCVLGQITYIFLRPNLVIYKMGLIITELRGLKCMIMERH